MGDERTAVVVGAGGDIGGACARELALSHDIVVCVDRNQERAKAIARAIPGRAKVVVADATDIGFAGSVTAAVENVRSVVHAIAYEEQSPAETITRDSIERSLAVGPVAALLTFRELLVKERLTAGASLVAIGSLHASMPFAGCVGYNAAHGALAQVVRSLAHEWADRRIRVNAVVPGWIRTQGETDLYGDEFLDSVASALPFGRFGTPADVASTVGFLCSDKAAYVSGSFFTVDGGLGASLARLPQGPPT
ncbi:glucose 1-dehydrogenase [Fodinicola feengrottensis]|uniref:Glucose 1-dehydrogenase n=1 Tax=Fodinicola feengrottensis TaxID=435914 RepID=A0ABN2HDY0_9ACTN